MATATSPRRAGGPDGAEAVRQVALPDVQPSAASIGLSEGARRRGLCRGAAGSHSERLHSIGPEPGAGKDLDPRRRSSLDRGLRIGLPGNGATRRLRPARLSGFLSPHTASHVEPRPRGRRLL